MAKDKGKKFVGPMGICECGHTGDGSGSEHGNSPLNGRGVGACFLCRCQKYVQMRWTRKYQNFLTMMK